MSRDLYHDLVKRALIDDGWTITHDPYVLAFGQHTLYVDLGAERLLAAEKGDEQIAVEIKSFIGRSPIDDLEHAIGQFLLYRSMLQRKEPGRTIFLAIPANTFETLFQSALGRVAIEDYELHLLVFDPSTEIINQWIPSLSIAKSSEI